MDGLPCQHQKLLHGGLAVFFGRMHVCFQPKEVANQRCCRCIPFLLGGVGSVGVVVVAVG